MKVEILAQNKYPSILTPEAVSFVATLHKVFNPTRLALLSQRHSLQLEINNGSLPDFLPETQPIRNDPTWRAAKPGPGLEDRRVEITGPVDRKMVINALNSNAYTFMADFEGNIQISVESKFNLFLCESEFITRVYLKY